MLINTSNNYSLSLRSALSYKGYTLPKAYSEPSQTSKIVFLEKQLTAFSCYLFWQQKFDLLKRVER